MAVSVSITVEASALQRQDARLQAIPQNMAAYVNSTIVPASQQRTDQSINQALAPHARPTDFETPKSRRWWYKVGITIWQGRKSKQDWTVSAAASDTGGQIIAVNPMPGSRYIFGDRQIRMHVGVWMNQDTYAQAERVALVQDFSEGWRILNA